MRYVYQSADTDPPFDCKTCEKQIKNNCRNAKNLKDSGVTEYTPDINQDLAEKKQKKVWNLGDIRLYECPISWITNETNIIIDQLFLVAEGQGLLFPGTWLEQPNWFVEAWNIYKSERNDSLSKDGSKTKRTT